MCILFQEKSDCIQLKEQLDLNSSTHSLILTILASIYIPFAFVSSYFGMNTRGFTDGGFVSTSTFWKVSIPLVVASIVIPVAFSGLLLWVATLVVRQAYQRLNSWSYSIIINVSIFPWVVGDIKTAVGLYASKLTAAMRRREMPGSGSPIGYSSTDVSDVQRQQSIEPAENGVV